MALVEKKEEQVDTSYMMNAEQSTAAAQIMADLKAKITTLRNMEKDMNEAKAKYEWLAQQYEHYKSKVVITAMQSTGYTHLQDDAGNFVKLENKYYLNPNKNEADRKIIEAWLKEHDGEHLLKHKAEVPGGEIDKLRELDIPFDDKIDVNTNSLKSFLLDQLGYKKGGQARINIEDIPECMHFVAAQDLVAG